MPNPFRPIKKAIFQRGGIGRSMSREDTIERLTPLIKQHTELNLYYNDAAQHLTDADLVAAIEREQKFARADVGKMLENVYSAGGVGFNGTSLEPADFHLAGDEDAILFRLLDLEQDFQDAVSAEFKTDPFEHQFRTQATLLNVQQHSQSRLDLLKQATRQRHRPATA